jgi:hypothetical protein
MKPSLKIIVLQPLYIAIMALFPGPAFSDSDTVNAIKSPDSNDTVQLVNMQAYLQMSHVNLSEGNAIGIAALQEPADAMKIGSPTWFAEMQAFQSYQNNMNQAIDLQNDVKRMAVAYAHMIDESGRAAREKDPAEQRHLFENFLFDSRVFLRDHFDPSYQLWVLRAVAAMKLNKPATGAQAGLILSLMPSSQRAEPRIQRLLAVLDSKGWVPKDTPAEAKPASGPAAAGKPGN